MAQKMTNEQYAEELSKVDQELKTLQHGLQDTLTVNDSLALGIEEKELELLKKEARIILLKEKNLAELQQLELERDASREHHRHEINCHIKSLDHLKTQQIRFNELELSNEKLFESIKYLSEVTTEDHHVHAINLHNMNKGISPFTSPF
jgi:hypothetical protein